MFRAATRSLLQSTRFSSTLTEGSATDPLANSGLQAVTASQRTSPIASTSKSKLPPVLNIPPAEDPLLHYLTSNIMKHGRRSKAARVTSRTLLHLHSFTRSEPLPLLREAILSASPAVKCLSHRHGSKNVHKPVALGEKQRTRFAVRWILEASDSKPGKTLEERLAREVIAVLEGNSKALAKKMELHRFAMVNRYVLILLHPSSVADILPGVTFLALNLLSFVDELGCPSFRTWVIYRTPDEFQNSFDVLDTQDIKIYSKYNNESEMIDWKRRLMRSPFALRKTGGIAPTRRPLWISKSRPLVCIVVIILIDLS